MLKNTLVVAQTKAKWKNIAPLIHISLKSCVRGYVPTLQWPEYA